MAIGSVADAYSRIRHNGARGEFTSKASLMYAGMAGDSVAMLLTYIYHDIAEEDDGRVFSVYDWELIKFYQTLVDDNFRQYVLRHSL